MVDKLRGKEALIHLGFRDVVYPHDYILDKMTVRTRSAVRTNLDSKIQTLEREGSMGAIDLAKDFRSQRDAVNEIMTPGGFGFNSEEFERLYGVTGFDHTYKDVVQYYIDVGLPSYIEPNKPDKDAANPGVACAGYLLDLLFILDPKIASFNDGVKIIIDAIRNGNGKINFTLLGGIIDDAIHLRGTEDFPVDFIMSIKEAKDLRDSLKKYMKPKEIEQFEYGYNIKYADLFLEVTGSSLN